VTQFVAVSAVSVEGGLLIKADNTVLDTQITGLIEANNALVGAVTDLARRVAVLEGTPDSDPEGPTDPVDPPVEDPEPPLTDENNDALTDEDGSPLVDGTD
jgi:hypothetical protein